MSDFTYRPSFTTSGTDEFKELVAEFGDGYKQTAPDGINPVREVWNLVFDPITTADIETIRAFFRARVGQTFTWTNPSGVEKRYRRTGSVNWDLAAITGRLQVTLEESFGA
jgi:phage-related protein